MKDKLKSIINGLLGMGLRMYSVVAHGREDLNDIIRAGKTFDVILDVGANVGQSVVKYRTLSALC